MVAAAMIAALGEQLPRRCHLQRSEPFLGRLGKRADSQGAGRAPRGVHCWSDSVMAWLSHIRFRCSWTFYSWLTLHSRSFLKLPQEVLAAEISAENQKPQPNCRTQDKNREDHTKSNEPFECFAKVRGRQLR